MGYTDLNAVARSDSARKAGAVDEPCDAEGKRG